MELSREIDLRVSGHVISLFIAWGNWLSVQYFAYRETNSHVTKKLHVPFQVVFFRTFLFRCFRSSQLVCFYVHYFVIHEDQSVFKIYYASIDRQSAKREQMCISNFKEKNVYLNPWSQTINLCTLNVGRNFSMDLFMIRMIFRELSF